MSRGANSGNIHQGPHKRVLTICSAGLLRSPTAAEVLSRAPFHFNTRAAGLVDQHALIQVDDILLIWADEIVCMQADEKDYLEKRMEKMTKKPIVCLDIEDEYAFRNPILVNAIRERYAQKTGFVMPESVDSIQGKLFKAQKAYQKLKEAVAVMGDGPDDSDEMMASDLFLSAFNDLAILDT